LAGSILTWATKLTGSAELSFTDELALSLGRTAIVLRSALAYVHQALVAVVAQLPASVARDCGAVTGRTRREVALKTRTGELLLSIAGGRSTILVSEVLLAIPLHSRGSDGLIGLLVGGYWLGEAIDGKGVY
jgi:hypothetical protein